MSYCQKEDGPVLRDWASHTSTATGTASAESSVANVIKLSSPLMTLRTMSVPLQAAPRAVCLGWT
jgi:hypothetical protein